MQAAGIKPNVKCNKKILIRAISTASFLTEQAPSKRSKECANKLFFGSKHRSKVKPEHYIEWGRIGMVANKRTHTSKMQSRGTPMMFVAYSLQHPSGTYEFYDPVNDSIVISNSVKWSNYTRWDASSSDSPVGKLSTTPSSTSSTSFLSDSDDDSDPQGAAVSSNKIELSRQTVLSDLMDSDNVQDLPDLPSPTGVVTRSQASRQPVPTLSASSPKRLSRELKGLQTSPSYKVTGNTVPTPIFNSDSNPVVNAVFTDDIHFQFSSVGGMSADADISMDVNFPPSLSDMLIMHTCIQSDPGEPTRWKDALFGPEREWWIQSTTAEFNNFISRNAWKFVDRSEVYNKGRKLIPTKLVFKKKDEIDGSIRFKTRDVTLGYMMIPGVDYTERFSPVATDASLRIQICLTLCYYSKGWRTMSCDIEAAFLEAEMNTDMFIEPHPAMVVCGFMTEEQRQSTAIKLI